MLVDRLKASGSLWEDPEFPASSSSLGNIEGVRTSVEWKRPSVSIEIIVELLFFYLN